MLDVLNIEVVYNSVVLVLKGVSLSVPKGRRRPPSALARADHREGDFILLRAERGEVTGADHVPKGSRSANSRPATSCGAARSRSLEGAQPAPPDH